MRNIYDKYAVEDVKEMVEALNGNYQFDIKSHKIKYRNGNVMIPKGSDELYEQMENFLEELDKRGYKVVKADATGCFCS